MSKSKPVARTRRLCGSNLSASCNQLFVQREDVEEVAENHHWDLKSATLPVGAFVEGSHRAQDPMRRGGTQVENSRVIAEECQFRSRARVVVHEHLVELFQSCAKVLKG